MAAGSAVARGSSRRRATAFAGRETAEARRDADEAAALSHAPIWGCSYESKSTRNNGEKLMPVQPWRISAHHIGRNSGLPCKPRAHGPARLVVCVPPQKGALAPRMAYRSLTPTASFTKVRQDEHVFPMDRTRPGSGPGSPEGPA